MKRISMSVVLSCGVCFAVAPARAWWPQGHSLISEAAVRALPADVPLFFRREAALVAHCAQDPDLWKNPALPQVTDTEAPDHFIDWELLQGRALPPTRRICQFVRAPQSRSAARRLRAIRGRGMDAALDHRFRGISKKSQRRKYSKQNWRLRGHFVALQRRFVYASAHDNRL